MSTAPGRPTVEQVGRVIRARTKDTAGNEVGTFDGETRPTDVQVEEQIDDSMAVIGIRLPALDKLRPETVEAVAAVVALDAACVIEKSYWPEQVLSDRSPYPLLKAERDEALDALVAKAEADVAADPTAPGVGGMGQVVIGSWTLAGQGPPA